MSFVQATTGGGRLADVGVADAGVAALLRWHLFSAGRPLGASRLLECSDPDRGGLAQRPRAHRGIGARGAGATGKAVGLRQHARGHAPGHRLRRARKRLLHLPPHVRFRNGRLRAGAQVSAARRAQVSAALSRPHRQPGGARHDARSRCARWPKAACTISSAAASIAIRWTSAGSCRISKRCSTTRRSLRSPTWRPSRLPASSPTPKPRAAFWITCCAT